MKHCRCTRFEKKPGQDALVVLTHISSWMRQRNPDDLVHHRAVLLEGRGGPQQNQASWGGGGCCGLVG